ncbi:hypothetical protein [Hymenobacter properus]|uniref:Uncharacterized protein n=1 Tax=Hymenobacter properus TaxID=2791026 RepID=A0A931FK62_9BACT|nr:hypothetical protein [Hymenobacter properus]MBF9142693.1 hypothetical protein [Hymenobacter properus]MBR7721501.1 hypothetical protein [Microvirga sp. SRT04]
MQVKSIQHEAKLSFRKICELLGNSSLRLDDEITPLEVLRIRDYASRQAEARRKDEQQKAIEQAKPKGQRKKEKRARREAKHSPKSKHKPVNPLNPNAYVFSKEVISKGVIYTPVNGKVK